MNRKTERKPIVSGIGVKVRGKCVCVQKGIYRSELKKAMDKIRCDKAAGMDGITAEMFKYGGETVVEWMCLICDRKKGTERSTKLKERGNYYIPALS